MGARCVLSKLAVTPFPFLLHLLVFSLLAQAAKPHECLAEQCATEHQRSLQNMQNMDDTDPVAHRRNCHVLRNYVECLRATARSCRGDLSYHMLSSMLVQWNNEHNCSYLDSSSSSSAAEQQPSPPPKPTRRPAPAKECSYGGRHEFRTCSLFGDPHLRTFKGQSQTCKVLGTWPLIDNDYLAVQVTNEAVVKGSKASATSMVTIIIKGHSPCSYEKTYEAQTDNLPATFIDGTQSSGPSQSVRIREREPGRHIEISIKYIATTIVLRQVGRYITFVVRAPKDVALRGSEQEGLHLCVRGCPAPERIDHRHVLAHPTSLRDQHGKPQQMAMSRDAAIALCKRQNVTDFYFESCIFDLMTTGDLSFGQAASEAMRDGRYLDRDGHGGIGNGGGADSPWSPVDATLVPLPPQDDENGANWGDHSTSAAANLFRTSGATEWRTLMCFLVLMLLLTNR